MWVSGAKLTLLCLPHSGKGGAMFTCVYGFVERFLFVEVVWC